MSKTKLCWFINGHCDYGDFEFTWLPPRWELHQTHRFPKLSQFDEAVLSPKWGDEIDNWHDTRVHNGQNTELWHALIPGADISALIGWNPHRNGLPYIYVFGNQWHSANTMPTAEYRMPGATAYKYVYDIFAVLPQNKEYWSIPEEINQDSIDFSWVPNPNDPPYIYHFGTEFQVSVGLLYTVPGATDPKFIGAPPILPESNLMAVMDIFFVDINNKSANSRFDALQIKHPTIQRVRFMNGWVETIKRCVTRSSTAKFWVISSENVYSDFDFEWHAEPWQNYLLHIFGSQWQKWSDTFLISKQEFLRHISWAKELSEFPNLHFVAEQKVYRPDDIYDIYYVEHMNPQSADQLARIQKRYPDVKTARYVDNYLDTFKRIMSTVETDYVWIINSVCDYSKFDFTWQPEPWQATMLHVFPSGDQKFGDTFYVHVPSFKAQMDKLALLDWFETVNYCDEQSALRLPPETVIYSQDSVVDAIVAHDFTGPYAFFKNASVTSQIPAFSPSLWRKKDKVVHVLSQSGSVVAVPREAKIAIKTQVYDYPYLLPHNELYVDDQQLDIVYISNGEPDAQRWYDHLLSCTAKGAKSPKVHWVKNVPGRAAAYKEAARVSTTAWFFAVFAKLEVNPEFDFRWQPDYLQEPKHYIFHAKNPVNGLEYGHMAILAYNKKLVLETDEYGLDFTLSKKHEVVELLSATAHFNQSPTITWRTAFRECIKLKAATDEVSAERLKVWTTVAEGDHAEWSIIGANDAVEYFDLVNGEHEKLMLSFEWSWLDQYFAHKYQS